MKDKDRSVLRFRDRPVHIGILIDRILDRAGFPLEPKEEAKVLTMKASKPAGTAG